MKRAKFIRYLEEHGCLLVREGAKHSVVVKLGTSCASTIPRHTEIQDFLAYKICKDLDIPKIRSGK